MLDTLLACCFDKNISTNSEQLIKCFASTFREHFWDFVKLFTVFSAPKVTTTCKFDKVYVENYHFK